MQLNHVTIRTRNLNATKDFFLSLFGELEEKPRPPADNRLPGHWLYAADDPIIRLVAARGYGMDKSAEAYDAVGFRHHDFSAFKTRLEENGVRHEVTENKDGDRRIAFRLPGGPMMEVIFDD